MAPVFMKHWLRMIQMAAIIHSPCLQSWSWNIPRSSKGMWLLMDLSSFHCRVHVAVKLLSAPPLKSMFWKKSQARCTLGLSHPASLTSCHSAVPHPHCGTIWARDKSEYWLLGLHCQCVPAWIEVIGRILCVAVEMLACCCPSLACWLPPSPRPLPISPRPSRPSTPA